MSSSEAVVGEPPARAVGSREQNIGALFEAVLTRGPLSRRDVARLTGMSAASVTKLVRPLIDHGYVVENDREADGPGRPQIPLQVAASRHLALGVKLMPNELVGVVADLHAEVQSSHRVRLARTNPQAVVDGITELSATLLDRLPDASSRLLGIGVGVSGHVDGASGVLRHSPLLNWTDVPLRRLIVERMNMPAVIENDVNTLAVAEQWFGPGSGFDSFAVVTVGAGVGCGLVINNRLWQGVSGLAGEFGHVIVAPDGPTCHCGKRGCLESVASDSAITAAMSKAVGRRISSVTQVVRLAHAGDKAAQQVFRDAGVALGRALATLVNLLNPPLIILSGEGIAASDLFMDALRTTLDQDAFSSAARDCSLLVRPLPDETWARGAAAAMLRVGVQNSLAALTDDARS
jgi:predicted NBD/HSP70 family sugar kinase